MLFVLSGIRSIQISYAGIMQCFNVTLVDTVEIPLCFKGLKI